MHSKVLKIKPSHNHYPRPTSGKYPKEILVLAFVIENETFSRVVRWLRGKQN